MNPITDSTVSSKAEITALSPASNNRRRTVRSSSKVGPALRIRNMRPKVQALEDALNVNRLIWLGGILYVPTDRLPRDELSSEQNSGWETRRGGGLITRGQLDLPKNTGQKQIACTNASPRLTITVR